MHSACCLASYYCSLPCAYLCLIILNIHNGFPFYIHIADSLSASASCHCSGCTVSTSFGCGILGTIKFPFTNTERPQCGVLAIHGCDDPKAPKSIQLSNTPTERFHVLYVESNSITITDETLGNYVQSESCKAFSNNYTLPPSSSLGSIYIKYNITLFRCNHSLSVNLPQHFYNYPKCPEYNIYYGRPNTEIPPGFKWPSSLTPCSKIQLGVKDESDTSNPFSFISHQIAIGVQLSADCIKCIDHERGQCQLDSEGKFYCVRGTRIWAVMKMGLALGLGYPIFVSLLGIHYLLNFLNSITSLAVTVTLVLIIVTLYYTRWKKQNPTHPLVNAFLERHGHLQVKRYSYFEMKKVTNSFNNKLGQGGFGCVYKGQLQDGSHVAVKILSELKGDGEEFINEVASMSRTSHVNIVALLGFCYEGSKQALVYEFMPNGSLEKLIYEENDMTVDHQLDCQTLYDIAIGVARGLEYLHRGCNTRILHFDIKPHNILLDENFCPKISDFGLAKVCTRKESIVSIFGARGTAGYIAPEVFSRNFGAVSHKSDVYSYGMMVLEMVGRRKNIKAEVDASSEIYFPHWIYNRLVSNQELGLRSIRNECDNEKVRKMTIVSLWCIQTKPSNRPSISKVVEMLEGRVELLQLPPKPFWFSPPTSPDHLSCETL